VTVCLLGQDPLTPDHLHLESVDESEDPQLSFPSPADIFTCTLPSQETPIEARSHRPGHPFLESLLSCLHQRFIELLVLVFKRLHPVCFMADLLPQLVELANLLSLLFCLLLNDETKIKRLP